VSACSCDWLLVAPWYRWPRQENELGLAPRASRPVIQKYEDPKLVQMFVAEPQHSLVWDNDDWVYQTSVLTAATAPSGPLAGKQTELSVPRNGGRFERYLATKTSIRKLFLDSHKRHYLVVCELHCDEAGFPDTNRGGVCQQGFVIRRRYTSYPAEAEGEATSILKDISALQLQLAKLERVPSAKRALKRFESFPPPNANGAVKAQKDQLRLAIAKQRKELRAWASVHGVSESHLGWIAGERRSVGSWQVVEEEPQTLLEDFFPLHPLVPPPDDPENSGTGSTMYFGLVPTSSADTDGTGLPRFDDHHLFEVRCFVRRHNPDCPRTLAPNDCNGELIWSKPTEPFRIAAHFDPVGTANRPINVQLPDFPALAAQAATRPVGALSPVRMNQPQRSSLKFTPDMPPSGGSVGDGQICFLAIPLITIVAWFVLNLFLPIVVFLFGLWFLLRLKFCLPPSIAINGAIEAELAVAAKAGLDIDVAVDATTTPPFDAGTLNTQLRNDVAASLPPGAATSLSDYANTPLVELDQAVAQPQKGPDFGASLVWETPVARAEAEALVA
jgi:hypothetical protein